MISRRRTPYEVPSSVLQTSRVLFWQRNLYDCFFFQQKSGGCSVGKKIYLDFFPIHQQRTPYSCVILSLGDTKDRTKNIPSDVTLIPFEGDLGDLEIERIRSKCKNLALKSKHSPLCCSLESIRSYKKHFAVCHSATDRMLFIPQE